MSLSKEQIALLENLTYLDNDAGAQVRAVSDYEGKTIGEWLTAAKVSSTDNPHANITGKEWNDIINAVKNDPTLMNMKIVDTHVDTAKGGGNGKSVVFVSEEQHEAVVAFKGTQSSKEWVDNFHGADTINSPQQKNALEWYQDTYRDNHLDQYSVTVTGHSKGGNKAKYITILDDTVDRCISFDGQGFSDEFYTEYADQIAAHQGKITNINAEYDFVNILLNDVGTTEFYKGYNYGDGGFLENHCPNAMLKFEEDGSFTMVPTEQAHEMQALDEFLNSYIRSLPVEERGDMIDLLAKIMSEKSKIGADNAADYFLNLATDPKYADDLSYLIAFTIRYGQAHPEALDEIKSALKECGLEDFNQYVDMAQALFNMELDLGLLGTYHFDDVLSLINGLGGVIPDWMMKALLNLLEEKTGVRLTVEQLRGLLRICGMTAAYMDTVNVNISGKDRHIESSGSAGGFNRLIIFLSKIKPQLEALAEQLHKVSQVGDDLDALAAEDIDSALGDIRKVIDKNSTKLRETEKAMKDMHTAFSEIVKLYEMTEKEIASHK